MRITKFVHACLLVEMPDPINRTALFDPGVMSEQALNVDALTHLNDVFITHQHNDHLSMDLMKRIVAKFPEVRVTAPTEVVMQLAAEGITASDQPPEGVSFFESPHEDVSPMFDQQPQEIGVHYLNVLSVPGDSHSFHETKPVLALPVSAPWGSTIRAIQLALELKPQHIIPVHDWHWSDAARELSYDRMEKLFAEKGITFHKMKTGVPVVIDL